jgi:hypothetical protein
MGADVNGRMKMSSWAEPELDWLAIAPGQV